ncbi:lipid-A-disaccharide synthase [Loktanella sp. D2R18]|uniref:lipid-A-disaccharide synthase n=1 Tax=Rhodobacterales TaxID=204455 RepID=UPI000DE840E3|nr:MULTISPECIES: lipid-A-disaccharide synthase [Rhodobacterales]MDO6589566.1 lipid-A-disaccharide synthase [Yoonia sp. 1_MG-2023]RBW44207.1 lipid-A-disaccharide synthase [Loktanella sp. D2R18]
MKVFVIAGEASGDKLGAALMDGLKQLRPDVTFDGVGGPLMQSHGLVSRFPMDELSVMGLAEILPKYRALKARIREMADAIVETKPDVLITIDSPDFCLRVAKLVKAQSDIRTVHYVAPTVWAWRPGRAQKMAAHIDHVLALFPFEPPLMQAAGMDCDFVGHPVVTDPIATQEQADALGQGTVVLVLPGSRRGEVGRLADRFGKAAGQIAAKVPNAMFVIPTTAGVVDLVREKTAQWDVPVTIVPPGSPEKAAWFRRADVALAASGTVSLELAANATPMVIAYDMAWLSRIIIGRMLRVDTVTLVNLVSETRVVPEFIGKNCASGPIAEAVIATLGNPTAQSDAMAETMKRLGAGGQPPGLRAAKAVLDRLPK